MVFNSLTLVRSFCEVGARFEITLDSKTPAVSSFVTGVSILTITGVTKRVFSTGKSSPEIDAAKSNANMLFIILKYIV